MISAKEALQRLRDGNRRFLASTRVQKTRLDHTRRAELMEKQHPLAVILSCSDSRVPPEIVFGQGLGDLFVVRVAGNIAGPTQVESVEFAALQFGTRLVVVLGHSQCGAILATLNYLKQSTKRQSRALRSIIQLIRPSVEPLLKTEAVHDENELLRQAVRTNVCLWAKRLRSTGVLAHLIEKDGLLVVGAEYSLETGRVEFFEDRGERSGT
jgi:carbonic anhydrase